MSLGQSLKQRLRLVGGLVLFMVLLHLINLALGGYLYQFGIVPRSLQSLPNILLSVFIHGSWWHLINNMLAFAVFSLLCLTNSIRFYLLGSLFIVLFGGALVWLFGRASVHIGASGWIFGLWSLLIFTAWFERRFTNILIALFVLLVYGGMVFGLLPRHPGVSFESHIFGAMAGVVCAYLLGRSRRNKA